MAEKLLSAALEQYRLLTYGQQIAHAVAELEDPARSRILCTRRSAI